MKSQYFQSVELEGTGSVHETPVHRYPTATHKLMDSALPNLLTVYDALQYRIGQEPDKKSLGKRSIIEIVTKDKQVKRTVNGTVETSTKKWSYFRLSDYSWMTYKEIGEATKSLGSGFVHLGLKRDSRVMVYAPTSREWMLCALASYSQGMQVVTAYDTLGEEGVLHAMNQAKVELVFMHVDQMPVMAKVIDRAETVRKIVVFHDAYGMPDKASQALEVVKTKRDVHALEEVMEMGEQFPSDLNVAGAEDIALVMYTSGTTGPPKGVLISHQALLSTSGAISELVPDYIDFETDKVLSYLPLSHVLAFFVETFCIYSGLGVGYGSPRTLTEDNVTECLGDIRTLRPAVMLGVPQVWNAIRAGILRQVSGKPAFVQKIFHGAVALKTWLRYYGLPTGILDSVVFKKTREATGGNLKIVITGGAPINQHVQKLINAAVCPMIQGYGMTEMSGLATVQVPGDVTLANIGTPVPSSECKLVDVPEANYYAANNEGEIWLRGPSVFKGYLDDPEETRKTLTSDGWVMTGDIGRWLPNGRLAIIDRKKNLVKLANGEYIALEHLESVYRNSKYVGNLCVCADSRMTQPVALVNIDAGQIGHWADEAGIKYADPAEAAHDPEFRRLVLADLLHHAKVNGLLKTESLMDLRIDPELWTPENGLLTAASKLKRVDIQKHNKSNLDEMLKALM